MPDFNHPISKPEIDRLRELGRLCRGDIIAMTTIAGSGHPGGSMSSIDIYLALYSCAKISPENFDDPQRDRIIVSHGHTSPGVYACLARLGFIDHGDLLTGFRRINSPFEGHIERHLPGVEWTTGNLGQGLSAGCGFALAAKIKGLKYHTYVVMSDAEQAKGQVAEARRFAKKYGLTDLTVLIDYNQFQISGRTTSIMPVNIKENYLADGWQSDEADGHDFTQLHEAIRRALSDANNPHMILCRTIMGKGVSFMENREKYPGELLSQALYHGQALKRDECAKALKELGVEDTIDQLIAGSKGRVARQYSRKDMPLPAVHAAPARTYAEKTDLRLAWGNALEDMAKANPENTFTVFDCDLAESVSTMNFFRVRPQNFFEAGVSEHTTATIAGALSVNGVCSIWADFGVFAVDEVYNQLRINDINNTSLKIVATHCGYNVGPDGKTHHCIDYLGLLRSLFGFKVVVPCDPNQADRIARFMLQQPGNFIMALGRTKLPVITDETGKPYFNDQYVCKYGAVDVVREGSDCAIFAMGAMVNQAIEAHAILKKEGIKARVYAVSSPLEIAKDIIKAAVLTRLVLSYEDHNPVTGLGCTIAHGLTDLQSVVKFIKIGVTQYGGSDEADVLYKKYSIDAGSVASLIKKNL
jgi:transketolase